MPRNIINMPSMLLTLVPICNTDAIALIAQDMAEFVIGQQADIDRTRIPPTDFEFVVKPYSIHHHQRPRFVAQRPSALRSGSG